MYDVDGKIVNVNIDSSHFSAVGLSKTKSWYVYKLSDKTSKIPTVIPELRHKLDRQFRQTNISTEISSIDYDGKFIISIRKINTSKKRSAESRVSHPHYIIFPSTTNYIFCSKMLTNDNFCLALARGLGFESAKKIKLTGKDPDELLKLLLYKDDQRNRIEHKEPEFIPKVKTTPSVIDFTCVKEKLEYADEVYDVDAKLQHLAFNLNSKKCVSKRLKGETFSAQMTLISPDVTGMIKDLIANNIVETPIPGYLRDALKYGKNILNIRQE